MQLSTEHNYLEVVKKVTGIMLCSGVASVEREVSLSQYQIELISGGEAARRTGGFHTACRREDRESETRFSLSALFLCMLESKLSKTFLIATPQCASLASK